MYVVLYIHVHVYATCHAQLVAFRLRVARLVSCITHACLYGVMNLIDACYV